MNTTVAQTAPTPAAPPRRPGLLEVMASNYSMEPAQFAAAVKKTAMPGNATNEEFAAFMMTAYEYKLNPLLKEIYAFPRKGGGIVPMVSIDGWVNIINSHPKLAGFSFEMQHDDKGNLVACTCTMHRTDRTMPTVVTEYLAECIRSTDPWKMKYRMLRHKALIQAARYCFGLSGIQDEDEARDIAMRDITPPPRPQASDFVVPATTQEIITEDGEIIEEEQAQPSASPQTQTEEKSPADPPAEQASAGDTSIQVPDEPDEIFNDGYFAYGEAKSVFDVPSEHQSDKDKVARWKNGWRAAEMKHKERGK